MLFRQSILYLLANGLAAAIGFLSVIVLTRLVAPADYGVFVVAMSIGTVLSTCFFTWQRHAILRFQSEHGADIRMSLLAGYMITLALHPIALLILLFLLHVPPAKALAAVMLAAAGAFFELGQEILRARQRVPAYVRGTLVRSLASFAFCITAVHYDMGGIGLVGAVICSYIFSSLISAPQLWRGPRKPIDRSTLKQLAAYGLPITLSGAFVALTLALDRFVLFSVLGADAAGVYGATAEFVRQCAIVPAISASLAIAPLAVATLDQEDGTATARHLADGAELLFAVMLPAVLGLAIAAPQVAGTVLGPAYREAAATLIPLLAFAFFAHSLSQQYIQLSFGLAKKSHLYIYHTAAIFLVNLTLMWPLVRWLGVAGAATSLLASETAGVFLGLWMMRHAYPLPRIDQRLLRILAAAIVMAISCLAARSLIHRTDVLGLVVLVVVGAVSYGAAALALNVARLRPLASISRLHRRGLATSRPSI